MSKLILRTCQPGGISANNFQWNLEIEGITTALDWEPTKACGNGLHGFLNGEGNGGLADWGKDAIWLVAEPIGEVIDLGGKVKFESAITKFVGDRDSATKYLVDLIGKGFEVIGATATAGYGGTATAGYGGTATAGYGGTATAGDRGTATAGDCGTATAGYRGTATAGYGGTATAGDRGAIVIRCGGGGRYRLKAGSIGEDGLEPNTPYELNEKQEFKKKC